MPFVNAYASDETIAFAISRVMHHNFAVAIIRFPVYKDAKQEQSSASKSESCIDLATDALSAFECTTPTFACDVKMGEARTRNASFCT